MSSSQKSNNTPKEPESDFGRELLQASLDLNNNAPEYPWRYEPVPFEEFVTSKDHMRFPKLSPKQMEASLAVFPEDPKKTFDAELKKFLVSCCLWGKGSGKDSCAALNACYVSYILLCLKTPYMFLTGYDVPDEPVDLVNVACNFAQASDIFFTKFSSRVRNWSWLRDNFRVRESQTDLDPVKDRESGRTSKKIVTIYPTAIKFPNNIRAFSRHSLVKGAEGYSPVYWCLDEASDMKFEDASALYDMLYSSANTRFPNRWAGSVLSFPRHRHDFTVWLYEEAASGRRPTVFASKGATWEVNPTKKYEDFKEELENPSTRRDALSRLACEPPAQKEAFFEDVEKVKACVNVNRKQVAELINTRRKMPTGAELIGKVIAKYNVPRYPDSIKCVAHVDLGRTHDLCGLAVGHLEGTRVIYDLIVYWEADRENKIPIDVDDPATILIELKRNFCNIVLCSFDQWNSASSQQRLNRANIVTIQKGNTFEDYKLWRQKTYEKNIEYPDVPKLTDPTFGEIVNLQLLNNDKVDHPKENTNEISECCVGVASRLLGTKKNVNNAESMEDHYQENEKDAMDSIWASEQTGNEATADPFSAGISGVSAKLR